MKTSKAYPFLLLFVLLVFVSGCATKKYVDQEIAALDVEMQDMKKSVEDNQSKISTNVQSISSVKKETQAIKEDTAEAMKMAKGKLVYSVTISNDQAKFMLGKAELSDEAKAIIDDLMNRLVNANDGVYLEIQGHCDTTGSKKWNYQLGLMRANAVKMYILEHYDVPLHKINTISFGEEKPIADNNTREGR